MRPLLGRGDSAATRRAVSGHGKEARPVRVTNCPRGLRVAGATLITLCLACCCTSCSPVASRLSSSPRLKSTPCPPGGAAGHGPADRVAARSPQSGGHRVVSSAPARQLWASTLRGAAAVAEVLSPDGSRLFVLGYVGPWMKIETVAYSTATGAQLWARTYPPRNSGGPGEVIAVSPDGARVYVTGYSIRQGSVTIAYAAGTGRQLWVSRFNHKGGVGGIAVSQDGRTVYEAGSGSVAGRGSYMAVIAYDAATGRQRWLRYYTRVNRAGAAAVAVSPDGKTVYVSGQAGALLPSSFTLLVLAYQAATGTLKWA